MSGRERKGGACPLGSSFALILYGSYRRDGENLEGELVRIREEKT